VSGAAELRRRVAQLDSELGDPRTELVHLIAVLARINDTGATPHTVSAADADSALAECRLLHHLNEIVPEVVTGPLAPQRQYWISTGKPAHRPRADPIPQESEFNTVSHNTVGMKPFDVGLFTSTGVLGRHGMWREYLDLHRGSTLHPTPWHSWTLIPDEDIAVREITTATHWVEFVRSYARQIGTLIYPDWTKIAAHYHAVHVTMRAIAAIQGLRFPVTDGIVQAAYWDVESTLWLRWCFRATQLVDIVA
jgi:hypothetical protein